MHVTVEAIPFQNGKFKSFTIHLNSHFESLATQFEWLAKRFEWLEMQSEGFDKEMSKQQSKT